MGFQTAVTIAQMLRDLREQRFVLPDIQRESVWSEDQIAQLFDSLMRGYPVTGWEPVDEADRRFGEGLGSLSGFGDIVLTTHGTVMAAWLGSTGLASNPFRFWAELRLPDAWEVDLAARRLRRLGRSSDRT